jgi:hypothetical protein
MKEERFDILTCTLATGRSGGANSEMGLGRRYKLPGRCVLSLSHAGADSGRSWRPLRIELDTWLRHLILSSSTRGLRTRYEKVTRPLSGRGTVMKRLCFRTG